MKKHNHAPMRASLLRFSLRNQDRSGIMSITFALGSLAG